MQGRRFLHSAMAGSLLAISAAHPARAADEEIQVYADEMDEPATFGLDLHLNDVTAGKSAPEFPGEEPSLHRWRLTPEFSYGVSRTVELGLYLPLATLAPDGSMRLEGVKGRVKWMPRHGSQGLYGGLNVEIGRVGHGLDQNPWNGELKLIGGWRRGRWLFGLNGNLDLALSGPNKGPATLELASKLGYRLRPKLTLGVESYNGLGSLDRLGHLASNDHATYVAVDTVLGSWDLNLGIGKGYGRNRDNTIVKLILGVPIGIGLNH